MSDDELLCCRECMPESGELTELERVDDKLKCPNCGHVYEKPQE